MHICLEFKEHKKSESLLSPWLYGICWAVGRDQLAEGRTQLHGVRGMVRRFPWRLCSWSIPSWPLFMGHHGVNCPILLHPPSGPNGWDNGKPSPPLWLFFSSIWSQQWYYEHKWYSVMKRNLPNFSSWLPQSSFSIKGICRWSRDGAEESWLRDLILLKSDGFFSTQLSDLSPHLSFSG